MITEIVAMLTLAALVFVSGLLFLLLWLSALAQMARLAIFAVVTRA